MAQWWERSSPTNVARVRFSYPASYVGWVCCWFSSLLARLPPMWPGFDSRTRRHMWVEFVVGSHPCSLILHFCNFSVQFSVSVVCLSVLSLIHLETTHKQSTIFLYITWVIANWLSNNRGQISNYEKENTIKERITTTLNSYHFNNTND